MLCFFFIFLLHFSILLKRKEEPRIIYQINQIVSHKSQQKSLRLFTHHNTIHCHQQNREQHSHDAHQHINLQQPLWRMFAAYFDHVYFKYAENKKEQWYQWIASEIMMREIIEVYTTAYPSQQEGQQRNLPQIVSFGNTDAHNNKNPLSQFKSSFNTNSIKTRLQILYS